MENRNKSEINISLLKGFAALLVFICHLKIDFSETLSFILGRIGVVIFFFCSGYLSYYSRKKRTGWEYLINRLWRIYPVYWFMLVCILLLRDFQIPFKEFLVNMTLFGQYFGYINIIGPSWMLSILLCYFIFISVVGKYIYEPRGEIVCSLGISCCTIVLSICKRVLNINLPLAIIMLFSVAYLGFCICMYRKGNLLSHNYVVICALQISSIFICCILGYSNKWARYVIAYGLALIMVYIFMKHTVYFKILIFISNVGYSFFLGAEVVYEILCRTEIFTRGRNISFLESCIFFALTFIFSYIITKYIEEPLLKRNH